MSNVSMTPEPNNTSVDRPESVVAEELTDAAPSTAENVEPGEQPTVKEAHDADPESEQGEEKAEKPRKPASERISQLVAQRKDAEAKAEFYKRDWAEAQRQLQALYQRMNDPEAPYDQSDQDRIRFALAEERQAELQRSAQRAEAEAYAKRAEAFQEKAAEFAQRNPDFWESFAQIPVPPSVADLIVESDRAPEIAYYLAKNPTVAANVARMPPHLQGREIARIEGRLQAAPVVRKASTAPPPPRTVGGQAQASVKDPSSMTDAEYSAWYRQRQSKRA